MSRANLTRPIIGIENRTPKEVFDIMCDRIISAKLAPVVDVEAVREAAKLLQGHRRYWELGERLARAIGDET